MNLKLNWVTSRVCLSTISLFSILIFSQPTHSKIPQVNNQKTQMNQLPTVRNSDNLARLSGKKVKLVGYYISQSTQPQITSNPDFTGVYIKSQIVLEDGTIVHIFPSWNKQSLRSASEAEKYRGKIVVATGIVNFAVPSPINAQTKESFINLEELINH